MEANNINAPSGHLLSGPGLQRHCCCRAIAIVHTVTCEEAVAAVKISCSTLMLGRKGEAFLHAAELFGIVIRLRYSNGFFFNTGAFLPQLPLLFLLLRIP